MKIPEAKLKPSFLKSLQAILGEKGYSLDHGDRLNYSRDALFRSTIETHFSKYGHFPAIIAWPQSAEQISQLIKLVKKHDMAITPYGGGSGVCGGAVSYQQGIMIDTKRMQKVVKIDPERMTVEVESGILALELEKRLARRGFTLGHFPSSILCACLGGFLATRSAGQYASKYGKIEDMVIDLEFVDGQGKIQQTSDVSRSQGFDLTQAIVGTEGTLGIITKARLKIYPQPEQKIFRTFTFENLAYGIESLRRIIQTGLRPDALRLYDELETALVLSKISRREISEEALANITPQPLFKQLKRLKATSLKLAFRSHRLVSELFELACKRCALIVVLEGHQKIIEQQLNIIKSVCHDLNAKDAGEDTALYWHQNRYSAAYESASLFRDGAFVETMEVATTWDNVQHLYQGIKRSLAPHCFVLGHIAHVYNEGAAIYFTLVAPLSDLKSSLSLYDKIVKTTLDATQRLGGVISHHHGIGRTKKRYLKKEWGDAVWLYQHLKDYFDPEGILNPGILAPEE